MLFLTKSFYILQTKLLCFPFLALNVKYRNIGSLGKKLSDVELR